jgi:hypothetical protein
MLRAELGNSRKENKAKQHALNNADLLKNMTLSSFFRKVEEAALPPDVRKSFAFPVTLLLISEAVPQNLR